MSRKIEQAIGAPIHQWTTNCSGQHRRHEDDEPVGEHLRQHDFRRHDRHDQQMLDGALLALADAPVTMTVSSVI